MDCGIPFCHNGCPLGNLIPEWNDYAYREDWTARHRAAARHEQLPGVHRPAVPGAVRVGVRARHQPARRSPSRTSRSPSSTRRGTTATSPRSRRSGCPARPSPSSAPGPAGLAAAQQLTRAGHTVAVYERADRIGGLLRYGIPEFKMEKRHINRRIEQMRAEGTKFRTGVEIGRDLDGRRAAQALRRRRHRRRRHHRPRPAGPRPRAQRHPPGDGVPAAGQQGAGGRLRRAPDHRRGQARRRHRRRRHRRGLRRHRPPPGRGLGHPAGDHAAARRGPARPTSPGRPAR